MGGGRDEGEEGKGREGNNERSTEVEGRKENRDKRQGREKEKHEKYKENNCTIISAAVTKSKDLI